MRWSELRDYHLRRVVIAETECGYITLGDLDDYRWDDEQIPGVQNGNVIKSHRAMVCSLQTETTVTGILDV